MCPSRFTRNNRVVTKPPFRDLSHPLGSLLYIQSFGIADEAVADDNGFLCCGHRGGGHKADEEQCGAEHLHGEFLSFEPASRHARRSLLAQAPHVQGVPAPMNPAASHWSSRVGPPSLHHARRGQPVDRGPNRKSTRLNSSHIT